VANNGGARGRYGGGGENDGWTACWAWRAGDDLVDIENGCTALSYRAPLRYRLCGGRQATENGIVMK